MMRMDVRGLTEREGFLMIRDAFRDLCGEELVAEILTDNPGMIPKLEAYCAMSGCTTEATRMDGYWTIALKGEAGFCR